MPIPALVLAATLAAASPAPCSDAPNQRALDACTARRALALRNDVERAYRDLEANAPTAARPLIARAQRAWRIYRDATCSSTAALFAGGTIAPTEYNVCEATLNAQRLRYLRYQRNPQTAPDPG